MISASFDFSKIAAKLDKLKDAAEQATRPAAQAGAQVFYDEVRSRVPISDKEHSTKGKKQTFRPGNLRDSIYQAYADEDSDDKRSAYRVSWNKKKAFYGRFVEFGTSRTAAQPFLRPGFDAARDKAVSAVKTVMAEQINKAKSS